MGRQKEGTMERKELGLHKEGAKETEEQWGRKAYKLKQRETENSKKRKKKSVREKST